MFKDIKLYLFCTLAAVLALIFAHLLWAGPMNITRSEILSGETRARFGGLASSIPFKIEGKPSTLNLERDGAAMLGIQGSNGSVEKVIVTVEFGSGFEDKMLIAWGVICRLLPEKDQKSFQSDFKTLMDSSSLFWAGMDVQKIFGKYLIYLNLDLKLKYGGVSMSAHETPLKSVPENMCDNDPTCVMRAGWLFTEGD